MAEGSFRNLVTVVIMIGALMTGSMMFLSGFLTSNGASLPASVNSTLTSQSKILSGLSTSIGTQVTNSTGSAQTLLGGNQSPNILSSIAATFAVFGGVIVALFSFIVSLPIAFVSIFGLFTNTSLDPFASVASIFFVIAIAMVGVTLLWAIIRAITKVDV